MAILPILVVSLERSKERRRHMEKELDRFGVDYSFFPAVDGNKLTREERQSYSLKHSVNLLGRHLDNTEIGCALSHVRVYEKMVAENIKELLILEDDCVFEDHFFELLNCRECWLPSEWGLINLWTHVQDSDIRQYTLRNLSSSIPPLQLIAIKRIHPYTTCYLINLHGAQQLLDIAYPIRMRADDLTGLASISRLNAYTILPLPAKIAGFTPTIRRPKRCRFPRYELFKGRQLIRWAKIRYGVGLKTKSMMEEDHSPRTLKRISRGGIIKAQVKKLMKVVRRVAG